MIKAILFDMDGLMFDTESAYSIVQENMSSKRGKAFTLEVKAPLMGKRAHEVMGTLNEYWGKNENPDDLLREQDGELVDIYNLHVEKMFGLDSLLSFLNENGIRKCVGTSSRKFLVDVLLKKHRLEDEFEFVVSGDMVQHGKPNPEIYNTCVEKLGLRSSECLVLEDSLNGVRAGREAGCKTCAVPSLFTSHEDFSIADIVAENLDDRCIKDFILV
jgi:HAD superfamily hydrolase (TIGR01509 family)